MSVVKHKDGRIAVIFNTSTPEDYYNYLRSLTELIQTQDKELSDHDTTYNTVGLLQEMLPNLEQVEKMFKE